MKSVKKEPDAGWNDPPKFSYCESMEFTKSPKRTLLNKRVAFPLQSTPLVNAATIDPTATPVFNANLPPPPTSNFPPKSEKVCDLNDNSDSLIHNSTDPKSTSETFPDVDQSESLPQLSDVLENLEAVLNEKCEVLNSYNKEELIKKKLQNMEELWKTDKLPDEVKLRLHKFAKYLKNKDKTAADKVQVSLMVDYPKHCSEFISAFRQLITID